MINATVTPIHRGHIRTDINRIVEGYQLGSAAEPNPDAPMDEGVVYNLVIDHPDATILWDTGSHPDAGEGHWPEASYAAFEHYDADEHPLPDALDDAGYDLGDIDAVVMSHLHLDHAGGLYRFDGTDVPVYVHEEEFKYAYNSAKTAEGSDAYVLGDFDHDLDWRIVHRPVETHFEGIEFVHLPGHTPGLLGLQLDLDSGTVIVTGDEVYVRPNYEEEIPLGSGLLWSKRDWYESLRELKERERRHDATVLCGHDETDLSRLESGL